MPSTQAPAVTPAYTAGVEAAWEDFMIRSAFENPLLARISLSIWGLAWLAWPAPLLAVDALERKHAMTAPKAEILLLQPMNLYPDNCVTAEPPSTPRGQRVSFDTLAFSLDYAQAFATTASLWREPCGSEKSAVLLRIEHPAQASGPLNLPSVELRPEQGKGLITLIPHLNFTRIPDDPRALARVFEVSETLFLQAYEVDGLEFDPNEEITLSFGTRLFNEVIASQPPGFVSAPATLPAYDPSLYAEAELPDLLTAHITGSYSDPERPGEGFLIELAQVGDNQVLALTWFTFADDGRQFWLVGAAPIQAGQRQVQLELRTSQGGRIAGNFGQTAVTSRLWGTISLALRACNRLEFQFQSTHNASDMPVASGNRTWTRLTQIAQLGCD
ncbi:hypothetical protein [Pseudomarimonas arenosa]|uniref:Uncharacterized protein n=1 Tax=Pseudomarimonas arenosa TaxID=2774145 RepID=A0AAW3ZHL5_9GAMM|nr:hypothetical protein [Pseudomarimonas arenosa]MBD8524477.1 hypothetical protein [Pseudomarimonas arenosa]